MDKNLLRVELQYDAAHAKSVGFRDIRYEVIKITGPHAYVPVRHPVEDGRVVTYIRPGDIVDDRTASLMGKVSTIVTTKLKV